MIPPSQTYERATEAWRAVSLGLHIHKGPQVEHFKSSPYKVRHSVLWFFSMLKALIYYNYHLKYITICETLFVAFSSYFSTLGTSKDRDGRTSPDFCNPVSTLTPHLLCWSDHKLGLFILHIPDSHFSPDRQGLNVDFLHISQCFVKYFLYLKTQNELAPHPSMAIEKWEGYFNFRGHS